MNNLLFMKANIDLQLNNKLLAVRKCCNKQYMLQLQRKMHSYYLFISNKNSNVIMYSITIILNNKISSTLLLKTKCLIMKKFKMFLFALFSSLSLMAQLNAGLMAYYPFNGNANDASGNNNNAVSNTAVLTQDRFGNPNSAYRFNGGLTTGGAIRVANSSTLNMTNQISICAWVRVSGFYSGTCHGNSILMKGDADYLPGNYLLRFDDGPFSNFTNCSNPVDIQHQNFYGVNAGTNFTGQAAAPFIIPNNQWYSVVYTYDGNTARLYINCILRDSTNITGLNFTNNDDLFLGRLNDGNYPYWFNGDMDEVRIYNRALNAVEISEYSGCCNANNTTNVNKCSNQNITLNARAGTTYQWSPAIGLSATNIQNPVCNATANITYTVTVANSVTNCSNTDIVNVIINPAPFSNLRDTSICSGDTLQLLGGMGSGYSWSPNYNISNTNIQNPYAWPDVTTAYFVTITASNGCTTKDTILVTVTDCGCEDSCNWSLTGNSNVVANNFLGSKNNADFKIRTFNQQRMVVKASGNVGIGTQAPSKLLEVNGEARIVNLPQSLVNERIVFANASGDLHALATTGNTNQYLSGNGSWQNIPPPGNSTINAQQGLTSTGNVVMLGSDCYTEDGQFINSRKINMNNRNLYFNSYESGKLFMGNTSNTSSEECMELHTRLEIGSAGLKAANNYDSPNPSTSGLRFTDLTSDSDPIDNETEGVLSLDKDGDIIWVKKCCNTGKDDDRLKDILDRLIKLENELKASKEEAILLKGQLTQMDILLSRNNTIVLNQNIPNPFEENTVITYMVPKTFRQAQIIFTSMNGEVIKTAEIKQSGKGQVNVFAKDISKGIYTYTLIVDGKTIDTKKMVKL